METKEIVLEALEAVLLAERIPNDSQDFETGEPIGKALQLKLCSAVNELTTDNGLEEGSLALAVTEQELWLMREKISLFDKVDGESVGHKLRRKIHRLLVEFNSEIAGLSFTETEESDYEKRKEEANARTADPNPDKNKTQDGTRKTPGARQNLPGPETKGPKKN